MRVDSQMTEFSFAEAKRIALVEKSNVIDLIWTIDRPPLQIRKNSVFVVRTEYAGESQKGNFLENG